MSSVRYIAQLVKQASSSNENTRGNSIRATTIHTANTKQKIVLNVTMDSYTNLRTEAYTSVPVKGAIPNPRFVQVVKMGIWLLERNTPNS